MTKQTPKLYAYKQFVTDKESFGYDESGARIGETPNIAMDAGSEELARLIADAVDLLEALKRLQTKCSHANWLFAQEAIAKAEGK